MSQQPLPCTPPPRTAEGGFIFLYGCLVFSKNVLTGKPEYFGVIQVKKTQNRVFLAYLLKPHFDKLNII